MEPSAVTNCGRLVAVLLRQAHGREVELLPGPHVVAVAPVDPALDELHLRVQNPQSAS